jgi:hypothetical protein
MGRESSVSSVSLERVILAAESIFEAARLSL